MPLNGRIAEFEPQASRPVSVVQALKGADCVGQLTRLIREIELDDVELSRRVSNQPQDAPVRQRVSGEQVRIHGQASFDASDEITRPTRFECTVAASSPRQPKDALTARSARAA